MEKLLKNLKIGAKLLARRSKAMWNALLATEQESKQLAGSILTSMTLQIQTEYMGTRSDSLWGARRHNRGSNRAFFAQYGKVAKFVGVISKGGIATDDIAIEIRLTHRRFNDINNTLICREKRMLVMVEGRRPYYWSCGASGYMAKTFPGKNGTPRPRTTVTTKTTVEAESNKAPDGVWKEVVTKGRKSTEVSSSPEKDVPLKQQQPYKERPEEQPEEQPEERPEEHLEERPEERLQ